MTVIIIAAIRIQSRCDVTAMISVEAAVARSGHCLRVFINYSLQLIRKQFRKVYLSASDLAVGKQFRKVYLSASDWAIGKQLSRIEENDFFSESFISSKEKRPELTYFGRKENEFPRLDCTRFVLRIMDKT